jgi:putative oxidoreductase
MNAAGLIRRASGLAARVPPSLPCLALRLAVAVPFWKSGVLKWESFPFAVNETAVLLFEAEFRLHFFGAEYAYPWPAATAHLVALAEVSLPVLLVLGLGTRFAALALLVMTATIQLTVPDGWPIHLTWFALALAILVFGPGRLALDHLLAKRFG